MSLAHLVAINCHPFHDLARLPACLDSVARAVLSFRREIGDRIDVRVFWHNTSPAPDTVQTRAAQHSFSYAHVPHNSNGENLNHQIAAAIAEGFDIFFRVDADDTVSRERFMAQSRTMIQTNCDLCGGGLQYVPTSAPPYEVIPPLRPNTLAYLENVFLLHPTLTLRLAAVEAASLRYEAVRPEDKALWLAAHRAGLMIHNLPVILGTYALHEGARTGVRIKAKAFFLNMKFLFYNKSLHLAPYALLLFVGHMFVGANGMRSMRQRVHAARCASPKITPKANPANTTPDGRKHIP